MTARTARFALAASIALIAALPLASQAARKKAIVSTTEQLLKSIAPNAEIVLKPGIYDLGKGQRIANKHVGWNRAGGVEELVIRDVSNLVIRGQDTEAASSIRTGDRGAFVFRLESSSGVRIESLNLGHSVPGPCLAGVVFLSDSSRIAFVDCLLSGSGSVGVEAEGCSDLSFSNLTFSDCSEGGVALREVGRASFEDCYFGKNGAFPLIVAEGCTSIKFRGCDFAGNSGDAVLGGEVGGYRPFDAEGGEGSETEVVFSDCSFTENAIETFQAKGPAYRLEGCFFEDNSFSDPEGGGYGDYFDEEGSAAGPGYYVHVASGLGISYPLTWDTGEEGEMAGFIDDRNSIAVLLVPAGAVPDGIDPIASPDAAFASAIPAFTGLMEEGMGMDINVLTGGSPAGPEYLPHKDFSGIADSGEKVLSMRLRVFSVEDALWVLAAFAENPELIAPGTEAGNILEGADLASRGD